MKNKDVKTITEYAGLVKDLNTGEYKELERNEYGTLISRERAIEKAKDYNSWNKDDYNFDTRDVIVRERKVTITRVCEEWTDSEDNKKYEQLEELITIAIDRFNEAGYDLNKVHKSNIFYNLLGKLEKEGYEEAKVYAETAPLNGRGLKRKKVTV